LRDTFATLDPQNGKLGRISSIRGGFLFLIAVLHGWSARGTKDTSKVFAREDGAERVDSCRDRQGADKNPECSGNGAAGEDRTHDLSLTKGVLYH
jgi:hypothetical protein